ncbi:hypothetical protein BDP27DRAFT_1427413 [Rhodocollybia butyracea]|uniref:Uncharacterized protein n=1 Tax=Rhodocollybia butyracea TaxID=206335 RepID=A0A9P5PIX4_9AGAR|nr:hypothetical protein BDP27DRAFT_1427413 [Rhodocollybia butyracea]
MSNDQLQPLSESDAIFARAYASAIKAKFQIDVGEHFCILTSPVTRRGMAAGDLTAPQITNHLIYTLADTLLYADNPIYTGVSAGSYIQQLRSYMDWIKPPSNPPQAVVDEMAKARDEAIAANANYFTVLSQAQDSFNRYKEIFYNHKFWQWTPEHYPFLADADRTRGSAQTELLQVMQSYYGPDAATLSTYIDNITNAQSSTAFSGYNQDGLVNDQNLVTGVIQYLNRRSNPPSELVKQSTIRVPTYSIPTYASTVQSWITDSRNGATRDEVITIDISQGRTTSWEDYGFKEVNGGGGSGFLPFCSADIYYNAWQWKTRTLRIRGREDSVSIQLAMLGVQKFDIQPGEWDVPNIKALFPGRLPEAPEALTSKYAKVVSVLVGYDVELRLEFAPEIREEINILYEAVRKTKGRMNIFGFRVSARPGDYWYDRVETKFEDVQWDKATGLMRLPANTGQVHPSILGVVARRFD